MARDRTAIDQLRRDLVEARIRREVEASLTRPPGKSTAGKIWAVFNTPFCLFLLSSVVLAGISQRFAAERSDASERSTRRTAYFKLFSELEYRITRLERDESQLGEIDVDAPGAAIAMRAIGHDAQGVVTGGGGDATSSPDFRNVYLGTVIDQLELTAGLPGNRELTPEVEALVIDDCATAVALHGELNILRKWVALRTPLLDVGKLPKLPAQVLSAGDQAALVMPSFDALRAQDDTPDDASTRRRIAALADACDAAG